MTYYYDDSAIRGCVGIIPDPGDTVIITGTAIHIEDKKYRGELSDRFAEECDFRFWFSDEKPEVELYTVPKLEVMGYDSRGGLFLGDTDSFRGEAPMYYLDRQRRCFLIPPDERGFPGRGMSWRECLTPDDGVEVFSSKEKAKKKYDIIDLKEPLEEMF